ncbi:MAG TPA: hypothetical protein VHC20_02400 [Candidatus Paceibacterota bacterium]|nr:hypothetical protein [Candidatus Paceibacterota bacterium]
MLHILFYTIIVILVLSFFGISLQSIVHSPQAQANFDYLWGLVLLGWHYVLGFYNLFIDWLGHFIH